MKSGLHNPVNTLGTTVPAGEQQIDAQVTYQLRQALYWLKANSQGLPTIEPLVNMANRCLRKAIILIKE